MIHDVLLGLIAGAAGTAALNILTYLDMALRGRPTSEVPAKMAMPISFGVDNRDFRVAMLRQRGPHLFSITSSPAVPVH